MDEISEEIMLTKEEEVSLLAMKAVINGRSVIETRGEITLTKEEEVTLLAVKAVIEGRVAIMVKPAGCPEHDAYAAGATPASVNSLIRKGVFRVRKMLNGRLLYIK